ncbi:MAG: YifB family Mg chelatase-like AAA ATPase [Clostridiales Family XIII bacterium]|jgi:magnesium chelatase family protein|nr:YifB family Mg chelatase-like AAA ATPase [Clostridiales Family XIII bacterium]
MISSVMTATLCGPDTELIRVETDISQGLPQLSIVGLPDATVRESKERVRSAIASSGCDFPLRRITVNLSPADTRKEGSHFDLPVAVGILIASEIIDPALTEGSAFFGELSLNGGLNRAEHGVALALGLKEKGIHSIFVPDGSIGEFTNIDGVSFYAASTLSEIVDHLSGLKPIVPAVFDFAGGWGGGDGAHATGSGCGAEGGGASPCAAAVAVCGDFAEVKGQERAKRALQICAAGRHDIAMYGPPGSGKSMLASRMPPILPPLSRREILEVTKIYSIAGRDPYEGRTVLGRPFRAPHHSISAAALVGGGSRPRPGELSLAHRGVLFLDELPEFERRALEMLRQPLEDRYIDLSRVGYRSRYPCEFILIAAMNPCPCGYYGDPTHECGCTERQRRRYASRVSGPLLDRIDLHTRVGRVEYSELSDTERGSCSSAELYAGVVKAVGRQRERNSPPDGAEASAGAEDEGEARFTYNGDLSASDTEKHCALTGEAERIMRSAYDAYGFSARQGKKLQRVARTIADLDGSDEILACHITEAISYRRPKDILGDAEG